MLGELKTKTEIFLPNIKIC